MTRSVLIKDWLASSDWSGWSRTSLAGDASSRRYERLTSSHHSAILMDAPPVTCGSQAQFVKIAAHLRSHGLAAPEIFHWDESTGIMVLEDLGHWDFSHHISDTSEEEMTLYEHAADVLEALRQTPVLDDLVRMTPRVGADMIGLAFDWAAADKSNQLRQETQETLKGLLLSSTPNPSVISLRDFHAENLIWRPAEHGVSRVGLLDFQDAFIAHPAYDLASLLRDARRDVSVDVSKKLLSTMAKRSGDPEAFINAFHIVSIQRNIRILGVFHRLAETFDKPAYKALLPRVHGHLLADLKAPVARELAPLVERAFLTDDRIS